MPDDENDDSPPQSEEVETEEIDPRDARIAELEAALAQAGAQVEALSQQLFTSQVAATGLLVDPGALPYDPALLGDPEAMQAAILSLIAASPWFAKLRVTGDVDQGAREETPPTNLMSILKDFT